MDDTQHLKRFVGDFDFRIDHAGFVSAITGFGIAWAGIPGARHDGLIIGCQAIFDMDPVSERTARRFVQTDSFGFFRPTGRLEFVHVGGGSIAIANVLDHLVKEILVDVSHHLGFQATAGRPADGGTHPDVGRCAKHLRYAVDLVDDHFFRPGRLHQALFYFDIGYDIAGQGSDFSHLAAPHRRFDPGVLAFFVKIFPVCFCAFLGTGIVGRRHSGEWMKGFAGLRIAVPGMLDVFGDDFRIDKIFAFQIGEFGSHRSGSEVFHHSLATQQEAFVEIAIGNAGIAVFRVISVAEHAFSRQSATIHHLVLGDVNVADCQQVRQVEIIDSGNAEVDRDIDDSQPGGVDRGIHVVHRNGAGHTADDILRVGIFSAIDYMSGHQFALTVQHRQVVGYCH